MSSADGRSSPHFDEENKGKFVYDLAVVCKDLEAQADADAAFTQRLSKAGVDINDADNDEPYTTCTALHWACSNGDTGAAELLIRNGADVNARALQQNDMQSSHLTATPLIMAAANNAVSLLKPLIDAKADVNAVDDDDGHSAFTIAAQHGHFDVLPVLARAAIDLNTDAEGNPLGYRRTPLSCALFFSAPASVVFELACQGADPNILDPSEYLGSNDPVRSAALAAAVGCPAGMLGLGADKAAAFESLKSEFSAHFERFKQERAE